MDEGGRVLEEDVISVKFRDGEVVDGGMPARLEESGSHRIAGTRLG